MKNKNVWKKLMANIKYSMGRNKVSGRPVKEIEISDEDLKDIFDAGKDKWESQDWEHQLDERERFKILELYKKDYEAGNVQFVSHIYNIMKQHYTDKEVDEICLLRVGVIKKLENGQEINVGG